MIRGIRIFATVIISSVMLALVRSESEVRELEDFYTDPKYENLFYKKNIICTSNNCPVPNACYDASTCRCADGYANYFEPGDNTANTGPYCTYIRKKQLTAFLLQFFIFCGAGQFYVGNIQFAVPQLIISLAPCVISCIQLCAGIRFKSDGDSRPCCHLVVVIINCIFACAFCGWWLADAIIFGMNKYTDGNGVPLEPW